MKEEKTLLILKPDCVAKGLVGEVLGRFERSGFGIRALKMTRLTTTVLDEHYAHLRDKAFFPEILAFMTSGPVVLAILEGPEAVARVREIVGPTDSRKAPKGTIRGDYGVDVMVNVVHASDSKDSAKVEIARFFSQSEIQQPGNPVTKSQR